MFPFWRRPSCPVLPGDKAWVEERLNWLCAEFTDARFLSRPVLLPTPEFFPGEYRGTHECVQRLFQSVCRHIDVPPETVRLDFFRDPSDRLDPQTADLLGVNASIRGYFEDDFVPTVSLERGTIQAKPIAAYALAHHAWARNEPKPGWLRYLEGEGARWCRASLRFLFKTGNTDFAPLSLDRFR
jgi:hypothetical protein